VVGGEEGGREGGIDVRVVSKQAVPGREGASLFQPKEVRGAQYSLFLFYVAGREGGREE